MNRIFPALFTLLLLTANASGQYKLMFEDQFDGDKLNPAVWNIEQNVGIWNTGSNRELERYRKENISVGKDSAGNSCLMITARKENYDGYSFTSGRINTKNKMTVKYGRIESRMKLPDLANGLWPAFWMLGSNSLPWPASGEMDILEAGNKDAIAANLQNRRFSGALHWDNAGAYAGYGKAFDSPSGLDTAFHIFTLDWTPTLVRMYLDSSATPYYAMDISGTNTEEFRNYEYYLLFNLAVGGLFPDIYTPDGITAPMPATLYIDYIKIYQKEGEGSFSDNLPVIGDLAVFADGQVYENALDLSFDATLNLNKLVTRDGETPKEGTQVLSFDVPVKDSFSLSIASDALRNMSNFTANGSIDFYIKTSLQGKLRVGIADSSGNESWLELNDTMASDPLRNQSWQRIVIPVKSFSGLDFSAVKKLFMIQGDPDSVGFISLDKILWSTTTVDFNYFGIFTDNPAIANKFVLDNVTNNIFIWENTMQAIANAPAYDGNNVLAFSSDASNTWYGFGINAANGLDFTQFSEGYLKLALRTSSTNDFWIGMGGAGSTEARIDFKNGSDPYGFVRDGKWHTLTIPMSDLLVKGIDLSSCGNIFMMGGAPSTTNILIDDIYLSISDTGISNSALNPKRDDPLNLPDNSIKADYWGVYTDNPNIQDKFVIDNVNGHLYIWSNTMVATTVTSTYEGNNALQFRSNGTLGWYGFGIFSTQSVNLSHFVTGYLSVALKTSSKNDFWISMEGAAKTKGTINFKNGSDPAGFLRDGKWHKVLIPLSSLTSQGLDLSACGYIFMLGGSTITDIGIDDIVFGIDASFPLNPDVHNQNTLVKDNKQLVSTVFPNPTRDQLMLKSENPLHEGYILIMDITGKTMKRFPVREGSVYESLDLSGLPAGMYFLHLQSGMDEEKLKFVKD